MKIDDKWKSQTTAERFGVMSDSDGSVDEGTVGPLIDIGTKNAKKTKRTRDPQRDKDRLTERAKQLQKYLSDLDNRETSKMSQEMKKMKTLELRKAMKTNNDGMKAHIDANTSKGFNNTVQTCFYTTLDGFYDVTLGSIDYLDEYAEQKVEEKTGRISNILGKLVESHIELVEDQIRQREANERLRQDFKELMNRTAEIFDQNRSLEKKNNKLIGEMSDLKTQNKELIDKNNEIIDRLNELRAQNNDLKTTAEDNTKTLRERKLQRRQQLQQMIQTHGRQLSVKEQRKIANSQLS